MNGVHDLGGMQDFGPVEREENEPVFHAQWERVMVAAQRTLMRQGIINIDEFRHGIERMEPAHYLGSSYYEHWLDGITRLLLEKGVITQEELDRRTTFFAERPDAPATAAINPLSLAGEGGGEGEVQEARQFPAPPTPQPVPALPRSTERPAAAPPRFAPGDRVVTKLMQPKGHTRLPRYARGKHGVVERLHGVHVFPDTNAHGLGEQPQPLYSVRFESQELWGDTAEPGQTVNLDLWESYLRGLRTED